MFGNNATKLIIVCDEKTEVYANYLCQLVSMNDDKDGEIVGTKDGAVEATVWLEKDYLSNKAQLSSKQHVIFIGNNKTSKKETSNMEVKFDEFGMKYGWLGKRGMMLVSDTIQQAEIYDEFIKFSSKYKIEFEKVVIKKSHVATTGVLAGASVISLLNPIALPVAGIALTAEGIANKNRQSKIKDQQYRTLTAVLYLEGLKEFLEA